MDTDGLSVFHMQTFVANVHPFPEAGEMNSFPTVYEVVHVHNLFDLPSCAFGL
jgi:hypothetical protein